MLVVGSYGAKGEVEQAEAEQRAFEVLRAGLVTGTERIKHNVNIRQMADIGSAVLSAEVAYRKGETQVRPSLHLHD